MMRGKTVLDVCCFFSVSQLEYDAELSEVNICKLSFECGPFEQASWVENSGIIND